MTVSSPDRRSGVIYERDGFEVFYGLGASEGDPMPSVKAKPDGYDKFYGIRSHDRHAEEGGVGAVGELSTGRVTKKSQVEQPAPSLQCQVQGPSEPAADPVPTFSVATPAAPHGPPMISTVPQGVRVFSVATPMPPPPQMC